MSRDISVQDIPDGISSVDAIPDDWEPRPLPFGHAEVVEAVRALVSDVDTTDPEWLHVNLPGVDVEVNVTDESPLESFALHVRSSDRKAADGFVGLLLGRLGARAFDPESEGGIFASQQASRTSAWSRGALIGMVELVAASASLDALQIMRSVNLAPMNVMLAK